MLDHHIQRTIVYRLGFTAGARFSELKPDDIENKLFTYHLQKVMAAGYVQKSEDGLYTLTAEGRRLGYQAIKSERYILDKAYSVLFLVVRRKSDGAWLLYKRGIHPFLGYATFAVGTPTAERTATETASHDLRLKTGLLGNFEALGGGFYHVYQNGELESYTNFSLLVCEDAVGELAQLDQNGEYWWDEDPDFTATDVLPNMPRLAELYQSGQPFFLEESFSIKQL